MKLFNTLTRQLEDFKPINPPHVSFYHCGPTVYWTQHIGNMRGMTMADLIRRSLMYVGYDVNFVRNYTDVGHLTSDADQGEDKMEKASRREKLSPDQIAQKYIDIFEKDILLLNNLPANHNPRASKYISEMIEMIKILIIKKHAYITSQAIYFDVSTFPDYNALNKQKIDLNIKGMGKGKADDPEKKHPTDFVLWFFKVGEYKNALQTWQSPWGVGFPGWHMECSAMSKKLLGETIDIHMGGVEHISIHHTNEIAQSESANGKAFVNYWLHNEHLTISGDKMAKSQGTGHSLSEIIEKGYDPLDLRYFFLTAHYRSRQNFTWEALKNAKQSREQFISTLQTIYQDYLPNKRDYSSKALEYKKSFIEAISNDIQIPQALAVLWNTVKSKDLLPVEKYKLALDFDHVFGLKLDLLPTQHLIPKEIMLLANQRQEAKDKKDFITADNIRKEIENKGYLIEDQVNGYQIKLKN